MSHEVILAATCNAWKWEAFTKQQGWVSYMKTTIIISTFFWWATSFGILYIKAGYHSSIEQGNLESLENLLESVKQHN
jgi:hypothetical protein